MAQPVPIHADKPQLLARRLELTIREIVPVESAIRSGLQQGPLPKLYPNFVRQWPKALRIAMNDTCSKSG